MLGRHCVKIVNTAVLILSMAYPTLEHFDAGLIWYDVPFKKLLRCIEKCTTWGRNDGLEIINYQALCVCQLMVAGMGGGGEFGV